MNEVEAKINELINLISDQEEVKRYKQIEKEMHQNKYIINKIEDFKKFQKKMVIYESHHNQIPEEVNKRYNSLYNELLEIPIYNEYITLQKEINELLQEITKIIEFELSLK
ncbi:YlbF family regulator [Mycoplasmatota bacterium]|nr:YlbF family regulator [Mycoplasmatota bacterium]